MSLHSRRLPTLSIRWPKARNPPKTWPQLSLNSIDMGHMIFRSPTAYSAISNISRRNGENELPLTFVASPLPIRSYMTYLPKQLLSRRISWRPRRRIADQQTVSLKSVLPLDHPEPWINGPAVHLPKGLFQTLEASVCPSRRAGTRRRGGERCKQHIYLTRKSPIITDSYRRRSSLATMSKARKHTAAS